MKRSLRSVRIGFATLLVALAFSLAAVPAFAEGVAVQAEAPLAIGSAAEPDDNAQAVEPRYVEEVNPLYVEELAGVNLIDEETILAELEKVPAPSDVGTLSLRSSEEEKGAAKGDVGENPDEAVFTSQDDASAYIREGMLDHAETISFTLITDSDFGSYIFPMFYAALAEPKAEDSDEYKSLVDYLRYDYAGVGCSCSGTYIEETYTITYTYLVSYFTSKEQTEYAFADAQKIVKSFGFGADASDYQKIKAIYDFICEHVVYDYAHLENDGYPLKYSAYAALENGTAVCQGYSQLLYLMCGYAGVPTRIISGWGVGSHGVERHSWNIVCLEQGGESTAYYNVDSTWDSSCSHAGQPYEYFLKSEADFADHERGSWEEVVDYASNEFYAAYPMADTSYKVPTVVQGDIEFVLEGEEAKASAYIPAPVNVASTKVEIPEAIELEGRLIPVTSVGEGFLSTSVGADTVKTVVLPRSIVVIESQAFLGTVISDINLPDGLQRIGDHAFWNCNYLTEISLPASLELVGVRAFGACFGMEKVRVLGPAQICEGAFIMLMEGSTVTVATHCQHHMIESGGDTFISPDVTALILAEPESSNPGHNLYQVEGAPSTCEHFGFSEYWECHACGMKFSDAEGLQELKEIVHHEPLGHEWGEWETISAPTCTKPGYEERVCARDSFHTQRVELEALGHDWGEGIVTVEPTETEDGVKTYSCTRCDATLTEPIPMTSWTLKETVDATCEKDGYYLYEKGLETRQEPIPALGHSFTKYVSDNNATCETDGTKTAHCDREGCDETHSVVDDANLAFGHSWGEWEKDTEASCTETGTEKRVCAHDASHVETRETKALGHDYFAVVIEPTCTEDGYTTHTCTRCNDSYTSDQIAALGHDWGKWMTDVEPSCTETGSEQRTCSRCGEAEMRDIEALGHDFWSVVTEPTCTEGGFTTWTCSRCGDSHTGDVIAALGHDWDAGEVTAEPNCTEAGERTFTCKRCNATEAREVDALGHDYHSVVTAPTCTEDGYTAHTCSRCGYTFIDSKSASLGHKWDAGKVTTAPTYTAKGVKTFMCTRCSATRTEAIAMLPKLAQTIAPAKKTYTVKFAKAKKKAQKIAVKFKASGNGAITYKAAKTAGGKVKIAKNGKVTVAKGTKKGTYTLKVKVTAAATTSHNAITTTVKLKIRVK